MRTRAASGGGGAAAARAAAIASAQARISAAQARISAAQVRIAQAQADIAALTNDIAIVTNAIEMLGRGLQQSKEFMQALLDLVHGIDFAFLQNIMGARGAIRDLIGRIMEIFGSFESSVALETGGITFRPIVGEIDENLLLLMYMDANFPGLREILEDPFASLYLNGNMARVALEFLQAQVNMRGEILLTGLDLMHSLQDVYILSAISRLVPEFNDVSVIEILHTMESFVSGSSVRHGVDPLFLNNQMVELLRFESAQYAARVAGSSYLQWREANMLFSSHAAQLVTGLSRMGTVGVSAMGGAGGRMSAQQVQQAPRPPTSTAPPAQVPRVQANTAPQQGISGTQTIRNVNHLDDILRNPNILRNSTPQEVHRFLQSNGHNVVPLGKGSTAGIPYSQGGGFRVNWGGDRILQYHPGGGVHSGSYWKISSGPTGSIRIPITGTFIP